MLDANTLYFDDVFEITLVEAPHQSKECAVCSEIVKMREDYYYLEVDGSDHVYSMCQDCRVTLMTEGKVKVQTGKLTLYHPTRAWYNNHRSRV